MIATMRTKVQRRCAVTLLLAVMTLFSLWAAFRGPEPVIEYVLVAMATFYGAASSFYAWCHARDERQTAGQ